MYWTLLLAISDTSLLKEGSPRPGQPPGTMDSSLVDPLSAPLHLNLPRRKQLRDVGSEADPPEISDISNFDNEDGFTTVVSRRIKRRMRTASQASGSNTSTIITTAKRPLTVVYTHVSPSDNLTNISKRGLYMFLKNLGPGQVKEIRLKSQMNVIAVDALSILTMEALFQVSIINGL